MEIRKEQRETAGVPPEEELAEINRFARTPLKAEEVYAFSLFPAAVRQRGGPGFRAVR